MKRSNMSSIKTLSEMRRMALSENGKSSDSSDDEKQKRKIRELEERIRRLEFLVLSADDPIYKKSPEPLAPPAYPSLTTKALARPLF